MSESAKLDYHILVAAGDRGQLDTLLAFGCALARTRQGQVTVLSVTPDGQPPDWLQLPEEHDGVPIAVRVKRSSEPSRAILNSMRLSPPDLLLLGWQGAQRRGRYLLGSTLDPVIKRAPCTVMVVRIKTRPGETQAGEPISASVDQIIGEIKSVVVPAAGGPNAVLAIQQGLDLGPETVVTALYIARKAMGSQEEALGQERLESILRPWAEEPRVKPIVVQADSIIEGILHEAVHHDLLFVGATEESMVERALFGNIPQQIASESAVPVIVVRRGRGRVTSLLRQLRWWFFEALPKLSVSERAEIYLAIWRGARPRIDFHIMIALAAAIASLGLLQDSPAVIIGAMLVAPLMSAVIGLGLGVVEGDLRLLRVALRAVLRGAGLAIIVGGVLGVLVGREAATAEILARTRPTLLDLAVALTSGAAGAYALSRKGVSASLPGVAIAAALVPPLATVGLCLTLGEFALAGGALLLFITNLIAITTVGGLVFLWLGFGPEPGERAEKRVFRRGLMGITALLVAIVLVLAAFTASSLSRSALNRIISEAIGQETMTMEGVEVATWYQVGQPEPVLSLEVTVRSTHEINREEAMALQRGLAARLGRPVSLTLSTIPTQQLAPIMPPH